MRQIGRYLSVCLLICFCGFSRAETATEPSLAAFLPGVDISLATVISHIPSVKGEDVPFLNAVISQDGKLLCYGCEADVEAGPVIDLRLINLQDGKVIAQSLVSEDFRLPAPECVSLDGKTIYFTAYYTDEPLRSLWKTDWTGSTPVRISPPKMKVLSAAFSPDGQHLAWIQQTNLDDDAPLYMLCVVDPQQPDKILERNQIFSGGSMCFSPDGQWIAISSKRGVDVINTTTWKEYTIFDPSTLTLSISAEATAPTAPTYYWLPDGRNLLISIESQLPGFVNVNKIYKISLKGQVSYVAEGGLFNQSPDGRSLYLHQNGKDWRLDLTVPRNPKEPI